jgi:hypothetical protein
MDDLEDELDLRYHKGLSPDVYYRCPTLEVQDTFRWAKQSWLKYFCSSLWTEHYETSWRKARPA